MRLLTGLLTFTLALPTFAAAAPVQGEKVEQPSGLASAFFPYIYFDRDKVLLEGIDFNATLKIAEIELEKGGADSILTIWAIRDQIVTPEIASQVSALYLKYIDGQGLQGLGNGFAVWHFAWAIGNLYRLGGVDVKAALQEAYEDALTRPSKLGLPLSGVLQEHLSGEQIYMGDAHAGGCWYAQTHIVIPGNPDYVQSLEAYLSL